MKNIVLATLMTLSCGVAMGQGTLADYNRAYSLRHTFSSDSVFHWARNIAWRDSTHIFHYEISTPEGKRYVVYNAETNDRQSYTSKAKMDSVLGIKPPPAPKPVYGRHHERHWMEVDEEQDVIPVPSPDGTKVAYIEGENVVIDGKPITQDGTIANYYSNQILWSPDGKYIFVCKRRPVEKRYVYYVESSPSDQLQPILHKQEYAKPGDELPQKFPVIIEVATGKQTIPVCASKVSRDKSIPSPIGGGAKPALLAGERLQYELGWFQWSPDSKEVTFEYNQRGHKLYQLLAMNAETGTLRTIVEETSDKFVNYPRIWRQFINDGKQVLWTSERDNWNHIYLFDVAKGKLIRQITKGDWCVREVQYVDEKNGKIYFSASGVNPNEDPYLTHYYIIGLDGKDMTCLTPEDANHNAVYSYDHRYLVDTYSKVNTAPQTVLIDVLAGDTPLPCKAVETADISKIQKAGWVAPEIFTAKGRDGKTDMWGVIYRPTNFDASKKYPVIEYIYAGPGDAYTPKSFRSYDWSMTSLAELGFVVVQLDAMGTAWRGKKFEEVCYKNLKDAGFPDRELWIKAACEKYPYMDSTRVGIFGASAGGQESTTAVLLHGDFYKAAYSSCGCHDNRMDKIWWNELWMGYPVDSSYVECSNVYNAPKLNRPLMLVVGELDDNVDPSSTYQVVNALIKANKNFDLVVLPGVHHTMGEWFGEHKRFDFFVKHLLGVDPPAWSDVNIR